MASVPLPEQTLAEAGIDALVVGQGEDAFAEVVERLADGGSLVDIGGVDAAGAEPGPLDGCATSTPSGARLLPDSRGGVLPAQGAAAGRLRLLPGCRFRCAFCADPFVYKRGWFGLHPARVGEELETLSRRYACTDVNFQDETFFTTPRRVAAIAEELLRRGTSFTWSATMRADQGYRLDEEVLGLCRRSGLRRG